MHAQLPADPLDARQFVVAVKKLADDLTYGSDRSPYVGPGLEFAQSRPYLPGDPVKSIDWRVTARTGKVFVREYEAPKRMPCYLVVDTSASMAVAGGRRSKYAVAVQMAGGLALACLDRASPVGVLAAGGRDLQTVPTLARPAVLQWLLRLRRYRFDEPTRVGRRLAELAPSLAARHLVVVLTDLHDPAAVPALKRLAQRHDAAVVRLLDPAEDGTPGGGFVRAAEAETGREFVTRAARRLADPAADERELRRAGVDHLVVRTDRPFVADLRNFLRSRGLLGRGQR